MRAEHLPFYAVHPHEIETDNKTLTVYAGILVCPASPAEETHIQITLS